MQEAEAPAMDEDAEIRSLVTLGGEDGGESPDAVQAEGAQAEGGDAAPGARRRRRRRGRGRGRGNGAAATAPAAGHAEGISEAGVIDVQPAGEEPDDEAAANGNGHDGPEGEGQGPKRRRRRRRRSRHGGASPGAVPGQPDAPATLPIQDAGGAYPAAASPAEPAREPLIPPQAAKPPQEQPPITESDDLEEIPGGWWQKMMGGTPGRGR